MATAPVQLTILGILLAIAVQSDVRRYRIPNIVCLCLLISGLTFQAALYGLNGLLLGIGGMLAGFLVLLPFYVLGGMGAGDVKLLAAGGSFLGPGAALIAGGMALVGGALLALGLLLYRAGVAFAVSGDVKQMTDAVLMFRKEHFPYALPIAAAVLGSFFYADVLLGRWF
jgi:prepilin peptidase CpaA